MANRQPRPRSTTRRSSRWLWTHDYTLFLRRLVQARESAELTQREAAELLGRSNTFVAKSETGERRVDAVELAHFATIYRKPLGFFFPFYQRGRSRSSSPRPR